MKIDKRDKLCKAVKYGCKWIKWMKLVKKKVVGSRMAVNQVIRQYFDKAKSVFVQDS